MIVFEAVSKRYGERLAVDRLSLHIGPGEFCVLIGASGSGKTTALRMVNRLIEPSSGTILVDGRPVSAVPPEQLRRHIGYAIQSVGLFPHWTVERNIATVPRLLGWPESRITARVDQLLTLVGLDPAGIRHLHPQQLSGGQAQRVGVARALAGDPPVLLMDEPFGALDPTTRTSLQDELARIHRQTDKTILFVTHDMDEALKLGSRIALLDDGRLVQAGTPRDILTAPANGLMAKFIGNQARSLGLLAMANAGRRLRPGEVCDGAPIKSTLPLSEAMSVMIIRGVDRLAVVDDGGTPLGVLHLADLASR